MALAQIKDVSGTGIHLPGDDIDTDRIIPARYLKCVTFDDLAGTHFYDVRFDPDGKPTGHPLDDPRFSGASIMLSGSNFGCGSSREHAPWALLDFGIRCVISTSFADIFYNNCFKNGILPITVTKEQLDALMADASDKENPELTVDLDAMEIRRPNGPVVKFDLDEFRRHCLLNGLDDIGLTMQKANKIDQFEADQKKAQPWLYI